MSKAAELAALIGSQSALSNRNLLINSAMKVAQRATSVSSYSSDAFCTVDRFKVRVGSLGVYTVSQATDAPNGFEYSLKLDCTTADASPASSDYLFLLQAIEGQDLQQLKKGTSDAESLTLSFYVKSNKTGTGQINLRDHDNNRLVGKTYTISSANTWEYKTLTFPADTTGAITSDNTSGISVEIWLDSGSDYEGGAVPTTWETRNQTDRNAAGNLNIGGSTDNEFLITGIQMEIGEQATPFEHRSFADDLTACQRYYETLIMGAGDFDLASTERTADDDRAKWDFKVRKRANCTAALGAGGSWGTGTPTFYNGTESVNFNRAGIFNLNGTGGTIGLVADSEL